MISFFVATLFVGGLATTAATPLAEAGSSPLTFAIVALTAVPLGFLDSFARRRYAGR